MRVLYRVLCETSGSLSENFKLFGINEVRNGQAGVGIYFEIFKNFLQMERLSAFVPNMNINDFFRWKYPLTQTTAYGDLFGNSWMLEFKPDYQNGYGIQVRARGVGQTPPALGWAECKIML